MLNYFKSYKIPWTQKLWDVNILLIKSNKVTSFRFLESEKADQIIEIFPQFNSILRKNCFMHL